MEGKPKAEPHPRESAFRYTWDGQTLHVILVAGTGRNLKAQKQPAAFSLQAFACPISSAEELRRVLPPVAVAYSL